jgi:aquaporin Z
VLKLPENGWHWPEWLAELAGTAIVLFAVVTAKDWAVRAGRPFSDVEVRICIIGAVAGLAVIAVALSRLGRQSGAHLNPAVTVGLWIQRAVSPADLAAYCVAQAIGAIAGVAAARLWGATITNPVVRWAVIAPSPHISHPAAAAIEAAGTLVQLACVFALLTSPRYHRWAPVLAGVQLAAFIAVLAQTTGAAFSPVRGLAPDVLAGRYPALWVYFAGPLAGAVIAALALRGIGWQPLTGKLRHDPTIACHMRCAIPHVDPPG